MNINDLVATSSLVKRYGVKAILYSEPGLGKTPLLTTAQAPVICFTEPGFLSVKNWQGPAYEAYTYARIREFWMWAIQSKEARQFNTFCCDSFSQMAEIILEEEFAKGPKDPRQAYGEMSKKVMEIANWIYFAKDFNAILIAKEGTDDERKRVRPYFPGQDLNVKIPHLFDSVWRMEQNKLPNGTMQRMMRTQTNFAAFARDRSGNLAEVENADITYLITKARA